jgi:hypothetical protein
MKQVMKLKSDFNEVNDPILQRQEKYVKNKIKKFKKKFRFQRKIKNK